MPWTLYRFILKEVLRTLAVSTLALVSAVALAVTIKPLSEGLLGPIEMIKVWIYSMPTMLPFVLPFSAAFSSTLVFNRMVADNEIVAARASGMSYIKILLPIVVLGVVLTVSLFYLSNYVIPKFYRTVERVATRDLITLLINQVQEEGTFEHSGVVMYADSAHDAPLWEPSADGPKITPRRRVELNGAALGRLDLNGKLRSEGTAETADLLIYDNEQGQSMVLIRLYNALYHESGTGAAAAEVEQLEIGPIVVESQFRNKPRFLSWPELKELQQSPERIDDIANDKRNVIGEMAREHVFARIIEQIETQPDARISFHSSLAGELHTIAAPSARRVADGLLLEGTDTTPVRASHLVDGIVDRTYEAPRAMIEVDYSEDLQALLATIELSEASIIETGTGAQSETRTVRFRRLRPLDAKGEPVDIVDDLEKMSAIELARVAQQQYPDHEMIAYHTEFLRIHLQQLSLRIIERVNARGASSVGCLLILMLGAVLSLKFQGTAPLVVFLWCFLLAAISSLVQNMGEQFTRDIDMPVATGVLVMWGGNAIVVFALLLNYYKLSRN